MQASFGLLSAGLAAAALAALCCSCAPALKGDDAAAAAAPVNKWVMRNADGPNNTWEDGLAYDPASGQVVLHGGHAWDYPQSNYTFLYSMATNKWRESAAPYRPQRRCLVMLTYLDSSGQMASTHGSSSHGSMPEGGFAGEYKRVFRSDPRGPWLYDLAADRWENCRLLGATWKRTAHTQCAYDPSADALVWLAGDSLGLYCPRTNQVSYRPLPEALKGRLSYGIADDPVRGKIVVFGGTGPLGWVWVKGDRDEAYGKYVRNDTWIYDIATDQWKECHPKTVPPRGMPLHDHRYINMVYHEPSGSILMLQNPVEKNEPDTSKWPPTELWSFDVGSEQWKPVPTENAPPLLGLLVYARNERQLVLFGGGADAMESVGDHKAPRASMSKQLWTCRVSIKEDEGSALPPKPDRDLVVTQTSPDAVELTVTPRGKDDWSKLLLRRAEASPFPGKFAIVRGSFENGNLVDKVEPGKVYVYQLASGNWPVSAAVSNQPWRPSGLTASVESARRVVLRWNANKEKNLLGYKVHRATGAEVEKGTGALLTAKPVGATEFVDTELDLSDGVCRTYWVTAVNAGGVESGPSPVAYTFPDPAPALGAKLAADGRSITVRWDWPKGVAVAGFNVYHVNEHIDTHGEPAEKIKAWFESWKPINEKPIAGREAVFTIPADDKAKHHYFYVRAVNSLGQEGLYTDIVSPTDYRFHP